MAQTDRCLAAPPVAQHVRELVARLDTVTAAERLAVVKELEAFGPEVLPLLPALELIDSPAARDVVARLRNRLERQLALQSTESARVTLTRADSVANLAAELTKQTGNSVRIPSTTEGVRLDVDWQQRPYWLALEEILGASKSAIHWDRAEGQFALRPLSSSDAFAKSVVHGPFRAMLARGQVRVLDDDTRLVRVPITIQVEPRMRPLFLRTRTRDWSGLAGDATVSPWNPSAEYELPFADGAAEVIWPLDLILSRTADTSAWMLRGTGAIHLAAGEERFVFEPQAQRRGVTRQRGGVTVRIKSVAFTPAAEGTLHAAVRITVAYETGGPAFESHRIGLFHRSAHLERLADGTSIPFSEHEVTAESDGAVTVEYRFPQLTPPAANYRFVYVAPTLLLDVPWEFDFRELPAPSAPSRK